APGGKSLAYFLPQQRRQVESDQVIEGAPRLLGIYEIERQPARLCHCLADRILGDLVENDAVNVLAVEITALLEDFLQVPGDGLTFAIRVGCQIEGFGLAQCL